MKPFKITNSYVYVVLEHHTQDKDSVVHGVYINENEAKGKVASILNKTKQEDRGYLAVLKKPLNGKERREDVERIFNEYICSSF